MKNLWTHTEEELFGTFVKCLIISHALSPGRMRLTHVRAESKEILGYISAPRWSILHAGNFGVFFLYILGEWSCVRSLEMPLVLNSLYSVSSAAHWD